MHGALPCADALVVADAVRQLHEAVLALAREIDRERLCRRIRASVEEHFRARGLCETGLHRIALIRRTEEKISDTRGARASGTMGVRGAWGPARAAVLAIAREIDALVATAGKANNLRAHTDAALADLALQARRAACATGRGVACQVRADVAAPRKRRLAAWLAPPLDARLVGRAGGITRAAVDWRRCEIRTHVVAASSRRLAQARPVGASLRRYAPSTTGAAVERVGLEVDAEAVAEHVLRRATGCRAGPFDTVVTRWAAVAAGPAVPRIAGDVYASALAGDLRGDAGGPRTGRARHAPIELAGGAASEQRDDRQRESPEPRRHVASGSPRSPHELGGIGVPSGSSLA